MMLQCSIELPPVNVNFAINAPNYFGGARILPVFGRILGSFRQNFDSIVFGDL